MKQTISFTDNVTTGLALKYISLLWWAIVKNTARGINALVHRFPWATVSLVLVASVVLSCVNIHRARSERDSANRALYQMQQKVDSMDVALSLKGGGR